MIQNLVSDIVLTTLLRPTADSSGLRYIYAYGQCLNWPNAHYLSCYLLIYQPNAIPLYTVTDCRRHALYKIM